MGRYVVRRLLQTVPVLFGTTLLMYSVVFILPGDPIRALWGLRRPPPGEVTRLRELYNLNDPFWVQYGKYLNDLLHGDFGQVYTGGKVRDVIEQSGPVTLRLLMLTVAIQLVVGVVAGLISAVRRGTVLDSSLLLATVLAVSIPVFTVASLLLNYVGRPLGMDAGGPGNIFGYLLPASALAVIPAAYVTRLTRLNLLEGMRSSHYRTALAMGFDERRIVWIHLLRNCLVPVVTLVGAEAGTLLTGAVFVEGIFGVPGLGSAVFFGIQSREGPLVVGIITLFVLIVVGLNLIVDLVCAVIDPRIRLV